MKTTLASNAAAALLIVLLALAMGAAELLIP